LQQLDRMARHFSGCAIKLCYEASYIGYCLQRDLVSNGIHCDIVSPSSIPSPRGNAIKTDRIDAGYLAQFYANDLLTIVQPPDEEQEQDRDLLRSRQKVMQQRNHLRKHLQSVLRRSGLHYKAETGNKSQTVDGRYQLFINGQRAGRGPVRSSPEFQRVDQLELAPYLKKGRNCIAVLVHVYGIDSWRVK